MTSSGSSRKNAMAFESYHWKEAYPSSLLAQVLTVMDCLYTETASTSTVSTTTTSRRLLRIQIPKATNKIRRETKTGARIRSLNFVAASNMSMEATMEAR